MKKILVEPAGRIHTYLMEMIHHPPEGYEFVLLNTSWDKVVFPILSSDTIYFGFQKWLNCFIPIRPHVFKSYLEGLFKKFPQDIVLTYSFGHLVFRKEPWVVELEWVTQPVGFSPDHLWRYRRLVEKKLTSEYCKAIICWSELCKQGILANLSCKDFRYKIKVVPHAVPPKKNFNKSYNDDQVRLLFVGSVNIPGEFELKGGKELLEAFRVLRKKHKHVVLTIRSDVPKYIEKQFLNLPGLRIIKEPLPRELLDKEYRSADIFIFPGHHTPFMVLLEAASYELPIVATDVYANREIIEDGKTGFLIKPSGKVPYYIKDYLPDGRSSCFKRAIRTLDQDIVKGIVEKTSVLIEDKELRRKMGRAARWEIEHGKFSINRRNEQLKRIFDEATGGARQYS